MSMTGGRPAVETSPPAESAIRLNECPVPRARTLPLLATSSWSSSSVRGRCTRSAWYTTLPAQLAGRPDIPHHLSGARPFPAPDPQFSRDQPACRTRATCAGCAPIRIKCWLRMGVLVKDGPGRVTGGAGGAYGLGLVSWPRVLKRGQRGRGDARAYPYGRPR